MRTDPHRLLLVLAGCTIAGCVARPQASFAPRPAPLVAQLLAERGDSGETANPKLAERETPAPHLQAADIAALPAPDLPAGARLGMRQALVLALLRNPSLSASFREIRVAEARRLQAALLPNPEIGVEVENVAGTAAGAEGTRAAETTVALSQVVELGGKRSWRMRQAGLERDLSAWDYEIHRLDVLRDTAHAFIEAVAAQSRVSLAQEALDLARDSARVAAKRLESGKVSPLEKAKADVYAASLEIALKRCQGELLAAQRNLAAMWGQEDGEAWELDGDIAALQPVPSLAALARHAATSPDIARWGAALELRRSALAAARAGRLPDVALTGGMRHENETAERSYLFGLSVPLPLFDRNQGAIQEAGQALKKAEQEKRAAELESRRLLAAAHRQLESAHSEANAVGTLLLPQARESLQASRRAYSGGKLGYLDVLDAQRTLLEVREQQLNAQAAYHKATADLERLIGVAIGDLAEDQGGSGSHVNPARDSE